MGVLGDEKQGPTLHEFLQSGTLFEDQYLKWVCNSQSSIWYLYFTIEYVSLFYVEKEELTKIVH